MARNNLSIFSKAERVFRPEAHFKPKENSRKFSPAFSRRRKAAILRDVARKEDKYKDYTYEVGYV
jgi:hypothetical protein